MKPGRKYVTLQNLESAINEIRAGLSLRLKQKGRGSFVSSHESFGVIMEEIGEATSAIKTMPEDFDDEIVDIAVACIFHLASRKSGGMQW